MSFETEEIPLLSCSVVMLTREDLQKRMEDCLQSPTQTVWEHCQSVWFNFELLLQYLKGENSLPSWWKAPSWLSPQFLGRLESLDIIKEYLTFHDCGKPFCVKIDPEGKSHFPRHEQVSHDIWLEMGGSSLVANLMLHDMDIHKLRAESLQDFCALSFAPTLMLAGIAEVHANAELFGGKDSIGFKIKSKHLQQKGNQAAKALNLI